MPGAGARAGGSGTEEMMSKTIALTARELRAYLFSPIAYVVAAIFLWLTGMFFGIQDFRPGEMAELRAFFSWANYTLVFVVPILTMRLVSEEKSRGTLETLMTAPVTDTQVILGKFLGAMGFAVMMLTLSLVCVFVMMAFGSPEVGPIVTSYVGLLLVSAAYIAIGLLASTCTRYQLVAAITSLVFLSVMTFLCDYLGHQAPAYARRAFWFVGFQSRYANFVRGTLPLADVVFFLSIIALALFVSIKVLESRKWRA
jgi:gliding motility-associated transport system permease protein